MYSHNSGFQPVLQAVEIRELIIRCLSQMVLARVNNVKSGWKSVFMVFTTAAGWLRMHTHKQNTQLCTNVKRYMRRSVSRILSNNESHTQICKHTGDKEPTIVRLSFDTIEKIVREHFNHITETETATFTDCVNCLIAFTNNPHSVGVALNSIAFLRCVYSCVLLNHNYSTKMCACMDTEIC